MVYCYAVKLDFIRARYLFAPAFFLYPWVGAGMERIFAFVKTSSRPKVFAFVFAFIFLIAPISKTAHSFGKHDNVIIKSGEWLAGQPGFSNAKIVTNEMLILFYAGRETYTDRGNGFERCRSSRKNFKNIKKLADKIQANVIIIKTSVRKKDILPELKPFKKIKEFIGKKSAVVIYCMPDSFSIFSRAGLADKG